jgi:hypothetical protein
MIEKDKAIEIVTSLCNEYYNREELGCAVSSLKNDIIRAINDLDNNETCVDGYISVKGKRSLIAVVDRLNKFKFGERVKVKIFKVDNDQETERKD